MKLNCKCHIVCEQKLYFIRFFPPYSLSRMKKERSCSGGTFEFQPSSPSSSRKHLNSKEKSSTTSTSRLRYLQHTSVPLVDLTIFHIPGLDVRVKI